MGQSDYRVTIELYAIPLMQGGGKPLVAVPDGSVTTRLEEGDAPLTEFPEGTYAFRVVPIETRRFNQGLKADEWSYEMPIKVAPLCFLGGLHVDRTQLENVFGPDSDQLDALDGYGDEFVVTKDDVLIPFVAGRDMILTQVDGVWEQAYPVPQSV